MVSWKDPQNPLPSETILWDILESITDAVVTIDEEHRIVLCNKAAELTFGYQCSEIIGKDVSPLIPCPHHDVHRGYVERYLNTGVPRVIGKARECLVQHKNGESFPVEISYSVSRTEGRMFFTAVIRDISKRKEMEREIRFMERLADIGKAVAHIVHEIRKPLMLIGGFARQLVNNHALEQEEMARRKLDIIVAEVRRLETLLNGIRLLTRPPASSEKRTLAVNQVLQETLGLLDPMLQDQLIELEVDLHPEPVTVHGDCDQLKQVFLNILTNAVEAMRGKGRIRVISKVHAEKVRILVEDNGPGISRKVQERVFDPFFTTKPEGTGLGLAISRNIIKDHGGTIVLDSSPPEGAVLIVELPIERV